MTLDQRHYDERASFSEDIGLRFRKFIHKVRNSITGIRECSSMVMEMDAGALSERQRKMLDIVLEESDVLQGVCEDISLLTKLQTGQLRLAVRSMQVHEMVERLLNRVSTISKRKNIELSYHPHDHEIDLICDTGMVREALKNLVVNALKYTPMDGRITITSSLFEADENSKDIQLNASISNFVALTVEDTGPGIATEDQDRIFRTFERLIQDSSTDEISMGSGMGLGLTISRDIARRHGGDILVESDLGKGSRFTLFIPIFQKHDKSLFKIILDDIINHAKDIKGYKLGVLLMRPHLEAPIDPMLSMEIEAEAKELEEMMAEKVRPTDIIFRMGVDVITIIPGGEVAIDTLLKRVHSSSQNSMDSVSSEPMLSKFVWGIAEYPRDSQSSMEILEHAEKDLHNRTVSLKGSEQ